MEKEVLNLFSTVPIYMQKNVIFTLGMGHKLSPAD